jgi:peroxiredoxin
MNARLIVTFIFIIAFMQVGVAQFETAHRMDETTRFFDKENNKQISFQDFQRLNREFPNQYMFIARYDKYGKTDYYLVRKKTKEEFETGHLNPLDGLEVPLVGQPVAPFVMQGADGKTYDSDELKGRYVLLSFWLKFKKPYFGSNNSKDLVTLVEKIQAKGTPLISLGVSYSSLEECETAMKEMKLGFIPVPDSRGFTIRYASPNVPSFLLIGPDGKVLARTEGDSPLKLEKYFTK